MTSEEDSRSLLTSNKAAKCLYTASRRREPNWRCADLALCLLLTPRPQRAISALPPRSSREGGSATVPIACCRQPEEEAYYDTGTLIKPSARVKTVTLAVRSGASEHLGGGRDADSLGVVAISS